MGNSVNHLGSENWSAACKCEVCGSANGVRGIRSPCALVPVCISLLCLSFFTNKTSVWPAISQAVSWAYRIPRALLLCCWAGSTSCFCLLPCSLLLLPLLCPFHLCWVLQQVPVPRQSRHSDSTQSWSLLLLCSPDVSEQLPNTKGVLVCLSLCKSSMFTLLLTKLVLPNYIQVHSVISEERQNLTHRVAGCHSNHSIHTYKQSSW